MRNRPHLYLVAEEETRELDLVEDLQDSEVEEASWVKILDSVETNQNLCSDKISLKVPLEWVVELEEVSLVEVLKHQHSDKTSQHLDKQVALSSVVADNQLEWERASVEAEECLVRTPNRIK